MQPALEAIRQALKGTPYEGRVWLVGGAVRDELLGKGHENDFDLVSTASASELAELLHDKGVSDIPPVEYPRFGTAMLRVEGIAIELVTARKESYSPDSRKPDVHPATLVEDAQRRDFTVNALMRNLETGELYDPLGKGLADLRDRVLRTPMNPVVQFRDDPLRMLRAVRFRWKLGFEPAAGLYDVIREEAPRLKIISGERIRDEFGKMLVLPDADHAMRDLMELKLFHQFAPELEEMVGVEQGDYHHLDVWEHSLLVLRNAGPGDLVLSLAALLHDVAKPQTRTVEPNGRVRFFTHEVKGAETAREIMRRLRFSGEEIDEVAKLVRHHMRLGTAKGFSASAARRLMRDLGDSLERFLKLVEADRDGHKPGLIELDLNAIRARLDSVRKDTPVNTLRSPLSGGEIMSLSGLPEGAGVGRIKSRLTEAVLDGKLLPGDKKSAEALVRKWTHKSERGKV